MMRRIKRIVGLALAGLAMASVSLPAVAEAGTVYNGSCGFTPGAPSYRNVGYGRIEADWWVGVSCTTWAPQWHYTTALQRWTGSSWSEVYGSRHTIYGSGAYGYNAFDVPVAGGNSYRSVVFNVWATG